jgi:hypothetical protein
MRAQVNQDDPELPVARIGLQGKDDPAIVCYSTSPKTLELSTQFVCPECRVKGIVCQEFKNFKDPVL